LHPSGTTKTKTILVRRQPELRAVVALAAAVLVGLVGTTSATAEPRAPAKTRITLIGDSITASFSYVAGARRYLGKGLDLRTDALVCRRLVAASCAFQGTTPATALQVVGAEGRALGSVVVINVGYNDWAAVYDVDRVMKALKSAGVQHVVWVTLREAGPNASIYAQSNARIRSAAKRYRKTLVVADWNAYSRGRPWFRDDGLHLTSSGAFGLAHLLRPLVLAGASS
jgi:GDSL-like lipase/acylhydrolase family protein